MNECSDGSLALVDFICPSNIDSNLSITDVHNILDFMTDISKNIYNSVIFCNTIYYKFKKYIYSNINSFFSTNPTLLTEDNIKIKIKIMEEYGKFYNLYIDSKDRIGKNNQIIYPYIKEYVKDLVIVNNNFHEIRSTVIKNLEKDNNWKFNTDLQRHAEFIYIVDNILEPIYLRNWNSTKDEIINKKPCTIQDTEFIMQIKANQCLFNNEKEIFMEKIKNIEISGLSDQNIISRFVYRHLGNNIDLLPSNVITEIINKAFVGYKSYYCLKEKNIKCNLPKYLDKSKKYNLIFCQNSFKVKDGYARLTIGEHISKNFNEITKNNSYQILNENQNAFYKAYVSNQYLKIKNIKTICKRKNYIVGDKYIEKINNNVIGGNYLNIKIPNKLKDKKIKMVEISPVYDGFRYKVSFIYANNVTPLEKEKMTSSNSISIDLGMTNLMSIYDPNGKAKIIKGGRIIAINNCYNNKIDKAKSKAKKMHNLDTTDEIRNMFIRRENKINSYFDNVAKWVENNYKNKHIIVGYNIGWKTGVNMGRKMNRKFYAIPYAKLLKKLKMKFGKRLIINEESYTSKCDGLALEEIGYHDKYLGERVKRGLFSSSKNKLINADINGAINIMRKVIKLKEITGCIYNPEIVKTIP